MRDGCVKERKSRLGAAPPNTTPRANSRRYREGQAGPSPCQGGSAMTRASDQRFRYAARRANALLCAPPSSRRNVAQEVVVKPTVPASEHGRAKGAGQGMLDSLQLRDDL